MLTTLIKNGVVLQVNLSTYRHSKFIARTIELLDDNSKTVRYTHVYIDHVSTKTVNLDDRYDYYKLFFTSIN